jgi:ABC-type multidrug transport system permease subunit
MPEERIGSPLAELTAARIRELMREPEAIFWVFVFPILIAGVLALAFRNRPPDAIPVAVLDGPSAADRAEALRSRSELEVRIVGEEEGRRDLTRGRVVLTIGGGHPPVYAFDPTRPESLAARLAVDDALQDAAGRGSAFDARAEEIQEPGSRYVDFFIPGLLGMNLMGTGMWGIGFSLVVARNGNLLKRFVAAPLKRSHLLGAQVLSRMIFLVPEAAVLLLFAWFVLDVPLRGSPLLLAGVSVLGALAFSGVGLLTASRARTIEGVSGLMNVTMVPMWICSGVFFSTERFPAAAQPFIQALPLTALNDALRGVMLDGAGLPGLAGELALLLAWGIGSFVVALKLFRWQ